MSEIALASWANAVAAHPVEAITRCGHCRGSGIAYNDIMYTSRRCPYCEGFGYYKLASPFAPALDAWDAEATRSLK